MTTRFYLYSVGVFFSVLLTGCASSTAEQFSITELFSSNDCQITQAQRRVIREQADAKTYFNTLSSAPEKLNTLIGKQDLQQKNVKESLLQATRDFDFSNGQLIFLARGSQPNPGFSIGLNARTASIESSKLILPVSLNSPEPGRMYPQLITSPCLLIAADSRSLISEIVLQGDQK